jgi:hypothetical protein
MALDIANYSPRLAMSYYPAIAVYVSLFLYNIIIKIRWKHAFKVCYLMLSLYLISICTVPSLKAQHLSSVEFRKLKYFPSDVAMQWAKENVKEGEKILTLRMMSAEFYRVKYGIDKIRMVDFWFHFNEISTFDKLRTFCRERNISYIMFPYSSAYINETRPAYDLFEDLKNNTYSEFMEITNFNLDENFIYIYSVKESS